MGKDWLRPSLHYADGWELHWPIQLKAPKGAKKGTDMKATFKMVVARGESSEDVLRESGKSLKVLQSFGLSWPEGATSIFFDKIASHEFSLSNCPFDLACEAGSQNHVMLKISFRPELRLTLEEIDSSFLTKKGAWHRAVSGCSFNELISFWREDRQSHLITNKDEEISRLKNEIIELKRIKNYVNELEANTSKYRKALNEVYRINGQGGPGSRRLVRQIIEDVI